jgi:ligand-binding sensor domain-containing protein
MTAKLVVGTRKGLFILKPHAKQWRIDAAMLLGDPVTMVHADREGGLHAAQDLGHFGVKIKRSRDGGETWEDRPVPTYPPKPEDEEDIDPTRRTPVPWDLKRIWALESAPNGDLWCGTIPGGLFRSHDGGESWQLIESLWRHPDRKAWFGGGADFPGIHSVLIDPRNPSVIRIGVSCGGLWISADDGESWECQGQGMRAAYMPPDQAYNRQVQDPHRIVQCDTAPDHLWIQHHNGIFRSTDGGKTCTEVETATPSSFGFACAVHPQDPGTAWFVPGVKDAARYAVDGALVVTRTRDGAATFDELREGLPQRHAYDIVYRHGLDIDARGDTLAFGSTTGNLWLSGDQGESWHQLSSSLPPIYCVRFVA